MAIQFDSKALEVFRGAQFVNANAIANINKANGGSLVQKGKLGGSIAKMFRSTATEARNNEIRTELLKALAKTFCLEDDIIDEFGGTCFTPAFMDKLSKLLGPAFKREDFGIDRRSGKVASGKPLTARRIAAIVKQADAHLGGELRLAHVLVGESLDDQLAERREFLVGASHRCPPFSAFVLRFTSGRSHRPGPGRPR